MTTITTTEACARAALTYRRFDYWVRMGVLDGLVIDAAPGSGNRRQVPERVVPVLVVLRRVADAVGGAPSSTELLRMVVEHFDEGRVMIADDIWLTWWTGAPIWSVAPDPPRTIAWSSS